MVRAGDIAAWLYQRDAFKAYILLEMEEIEFGSGGKYLFFQLVNEISQVIGFSVLSLVLIRILR